MKSYWWSGGTTLHIPNLTALPLVKGSSTYWIGGWVYKNIYIIKLCISWGVSGQGYETVCVCVCVRARATGLCSATENLVLECCGQQIVLLWGRLHNGPCTSAKVCSEFT